MSHGIDIDRHSAGVTIDYPAGQCCGRGVTLEEAIIDLLNIYYERGKTHGRQTMADKRVKTVVEVLSVSCSHFQMPTAIVRVKQKHLAGEDQGSTLVRLGQPFDVDAVINKSKLL